MANLYCTREQVKRAASINGSDQDPIVDRLIEAYSRSIDRSHRRRYIPETATYLEAWPNRGGRGWVLWLRRDLISIATLQTRAQDASPTTITASDYFLEPQQSGPPFDRIEIDLSSSAAFEGGSTPQRSISIAGSWGYSGDTRSVGTVSSGLASSSSDTSMVCSDGSVIDVGNTLLIESEQIFVSDRKYTTSGITLNGALTASITEQTITVTNSASFNIGEKIRVESEVMLIWEITGNDLEVFRAYDGSVLAAHSDSTAVEHNQSLTIERGVNGTTAATHANATAISKYEPPFDISQLCIAETIAAYQQERAGWGRNVGAGEGATEFVGRDLAGRRKELLMQYQRVREAAI